MTRHIPILLEPIVDSLVGSLVSPGVVVDCTLGGGGHTAALLERSPPGTIVISVDQDQTAIERASARFAREISDQKLFLVQGRFSELLRRMPPEVTGVPVLGVLADLGFSSDQIDSAERGLSFRLEGPLDMRLDPSQGRTAYQLLKTETEAELARILWEYGEERLSRKIASRVIQARSKGQLPDTTTGFADFVSRCFPPAQRHGRIHPSTRTFQALRIAVNDEMGELDALLKDVLPSLVSVGGRVAFLSFHSLEDRMIKTFFRKHENWRALSKKPIEASPEELDRNPRARSAKLRTYERESEA